MNDAPAELLAALAPALLAGRAPAWARLDPQGRVLELGGELDAHGLGRLVVDAILKRDYPIIQGLILMFSFVYILINLMIDILYTLVDPRIRY